MIILRTEVPILLGNGRGLNSTLAETREASGMCVGQLPKYIYYNISRPVGFRTGGISFEDSWRSSLGLPDSRLIQDSALLFCYDQFVY